MRKLLTTIMAMMLVAAPFANASQGFSNSASVSLSMVIPSTFTVSVTPASVSFDQNGNASGPISVTTTWNLGSQQTGDYLATDAYFSDPAVALQGATNVNDRIPTSAVFAAMGTQAPLPCNNTDSRVAAAVPNATCGAVLFIGNLANTQGTHTDNITLSIPSAANLAPDSYAGSITVSAQFN